MRIMNKLNFKSFALAALCALAAVACDPEYDVNPGKDPQNPDKPDPKPIIDPTIVIFPDVTIKVDTTVGLTVQEFVPKKLERIKIDDDGDFFVECHNDGSTDTLLTKEVFEQISEVAIPADYKIPYNFLPDYLDGQLNLECPLVFQVDNPTDTPMSLSAKVRNDSKELEIVDVPVIPGSSQIPVAIEELLKPFSSDIRITDVSLNKVQSAPETGAQAAPASASDLKFSVLPFMPLRFYAGNIIEFTYGADLFKEAKIKEIIDKKNLDDKYKKMALDITVTNSIPFDLTISAKPGDTGVTGTLALDNPIKAGRPGAPVVSNVKLNMEFSGGLGDIYKIKLAVKAAVPADTEGYVTLNSAQKIDMCINSILVNGFEL